MKVYGPYLRKDGRQHVIVVTGKGRRTVSYPKWIMEQHLGRRLDPNRETVDHIDRDFTNNSIENLQILPRSKHAEIDAVRVQDVDLTCALCGCTFSRSARAINHGAREGKAGPFCTKSCAGRYGAMVQNGGQKLPSAKEIPVDGRTYHRSKKGAVS